MSPSVVSRTALERRLTTLEVRLDETNKAVNGIGKGMRELRTLNEEQMKVLEPIKIKLDAVMWTLRVLIIALVTAGAAEWLYSVFRHQP